MAKQSLSAYRENLNGSAAKSTSGTSSSSTAGTTKVSGTAKAVSTPTVSQTKTVSLQPANTSSGTAKSTSSGSSVTFQPNGTSKTTSSSGTAGSSGGGNTNYSYKDLYRNAGVDSAALNKKSYDQNDIKTYGNRETAYNFYDKNTGKTNTVYSNLTNYKDAAKAAGYDLADEGKTWSLSSAASYGVAGSSGRGTSYGASGGSYVYNQPASGGFYGEAMRAVNNANDQYGGLQNVVRNNDSQYKEYMQGNYLPIYGQDPNTINWSEVANGTAAQNFYNNDGVLAQEPVIEQQTNNFWDKYLQNLQEGLAYNAVDLAYTPPSYGETSISDAVNNAIENGANALGYNPYTSYMQYQPINAAQWNYDVPETVRMQNQYGNYTPATTAYGDMLSSAVSDADLAMAQYWSEIAATAKSENDRQYALRQALNYRNKIA